jgi:hypothetical protein
MNNEFNSALEKQEIIGHRNFIELYHDRILDIRADECIKLHDMRCVLSDYWYECKADYSSFTNRFLIEYKANVPSDRLRGLPLRKELDHWQYAEQFNSIEEKYNALATDLNNLEPRHFLSYWFRKTNQYYLMDIRELRNQINLSAYPFFICGGRAEDWKSICVIVPIADVKILAKKESPN